MDKKEFKNQEEENKNLRKWILVLGILTGIFLMTTIYFGFFGAPVMNTQYIKVETEKLNLEKELEDLLAEHNEIKERMGDLTLQLSEKDSIILANAEEIKKMIDRQADYNKIKKQLRRLQETAKEYVEEMDKLYQENKTLKEENVLIKESLAVEQEKSATYQKDKENLSQKINSAAIYTAYNIYARAIYMKNKNDAEVITEKANKAKRFKVSMILGENSLLPPGPVNIYCRIAIPDGRVLMMGNSDVYSFMHNGQKLQYTAKTTINYTNKA
jgi:cell division protein FtsB